MSDYLNEEMQRRLWEGQAANNKRMLVAIEEQGRAITDLESAWAVTRLILADMIVSLPDPAGYHRQLSERLLTTTPDMQSPGAPNGAKGALKDILASLRPKG
jgi:hypothetical protein